MHRVLQVLVGLVCLFAAPTVPVAETIVYHGIEFPDLFAGGERGRTVDYEKDDPGLGYGAEYRHRGAISTFYIYDNGLTSIPNDFNTPAVKQEFEKAREDIAKVRLREGMLLKSIGIFGIFDGTNQPRLACEGFDLDNSKPPRDSYLCIGVLKGKFIKVRTSMVRSPASQLELRRFVGAWADVL